MLKHNLLIAAVAAAFLVAPHLVQAQPQAENGDPMLIYREAGANKDQQKQIESLVHEWEQGARPKSEKARALLKKMDELSLQPMPDEKQVMETQSELNSLSAEMANARIRLQLKIRSVLTGEQRKRLVDLLKTHRQAPGSAAP
jgi:Spy/CpxP family protein refolding chaperone